ncbi:MAG: efflux RND transporter periplasmic adaptor subunit [Planctomycetota bacterium]
MTIAIAGGLAAGCDNSNEFQAPPPPPVVVSQPQQRSVIDYATFTGTTSAADSVDIRAQVGGIIDDVPVDDGAPVEEGDLLFVINAESYTAARDAAQAQLDQAKAKQALADAKAQRIERSAADGAVSQLQAIEARAEAEVANAAVTVAERELAIKQLDLDYATVEAPRKGRIRKAGLGVGDLVAPSGDGGLLGTIFDDSEITVAFTVPDRVYLTAIRRAGGDESRRPPLIELGTEIDDGYPYTGGITYADPIVDEQTGTVRVEATVQNPDRQLVGGLFVRVRMPVETLPSAIVVPQVAIARDQVGPYVLVVGEGNVVERRDVELGGVDGADRVVRSGLSAEDSIVVSGLMRARPGAPVTPIPAESE